MLISQYNDPNTGSDAMKGINLNKPIKYRAASFRFFEENERHISRVCGEDVLLLIFDGVLRFSEDGEEREVRKGEYYIQKKNVFQQGNKVSDSPKYLYVHFTSEWDGDSVLPYQGNFDYEELSSQMEELNRLYYNHGTLTEQTAVFLEILTKLYRSKNETTAAAKIAEFLYQKYAEPITLEMLSKEFNFSKNHIINIFKKEYKTTPFEYLNRLKLRQAEQLLAVTSLPVETVCYKCGFNDYSYFYKLFRRKNGISPKEWRSKKRGYEEPN